MTRTLVLGAGFGGLAVATGLRQSLPEEHEIVLVDERESFAMGLRKLWDIVGIGTIAEGSRSRESLNERGIRFVQEEIVAIDPARRSAVIGGESMDGDHLVVALGARSRPDLVQGLESHGHNAWDIDGVPRLREAFDSLDRGRIVIAIAGAPYRCPPAPYELTMLLDDVLRERGIRNRIELEVSTLAPMLMPNAGLAGSQLIADLLDAKEIGHSVGRGVERIEAGRVIYADAELEFDLLIGIPPDRAPGVVTESGLTGEGEWVEVDRGTLATKHEGVFAIGDINQIKLANGLPMPMAGSFAELQGERVAGAIAAEILGTDPPAPFDGRGACFLEVGTAQAAMVEGEFFAEPEPQVQITEPTTTHAAEKRSFESERLARWFGA